MEGVLWDLVNNIIYRIKTPARPRVRNAIILMVQKTRVVSCLFPRHNFVGSLEPGEEDVYWKMRGGKLASVLFWAKHLAPSHLQVLHCKPAKLNYILASSLKWEHRGDLGGDCAANSPLSQRGHLSFGFPPSSFMHFAIFSTLQYCCFNAAWAIAPSRRRSNHFY